MGWSMIIRLATEADVPAITEIYNEAILTTTATFDTEPKTIENRLEWFKQHDEKLPIWVCEFKNKVVGWGTLSLWSDRCAYSATVENSVYVLEEFRGRGIGKLLMEALISSALENKYHTIIARIADGNEVSVKLHKDYGFEPIGIMREVGKKFNRLLDVHMMQKIL
jgi:L-amino acid N-acyltransferase YncA